MIQWKQRLYAFLLRRLLGPILDASSIQKLHDSIDVSLNEGRFTLNDILLNAEHLTNLAASSSSGVVIQRARIEQLEIFLTLRENDYTSDASKLSDPSNANTSSLAWRAMKLGTSNADLPAVSIIAEINVTGIFIELAPTKVRRTRQPPAPPTPPTTATDASMMDDETTKPHHRKTNSMIGSYVDSALNSLQLNLKMANVNIKLCTSGEPSAAESASPSKNESWIEICLSSTSYKDLETRTASGNPSEYKTMFHKAIDFSGLTIRTGQQADNNNNPVVSTIANVQGTGQVFVRAVEYYNMTTTGSSATETQIQQDIEIRLNQQINMHVDGTSIGVIGSVADSFSQEPLEELVIHNDLELQLEEETNKALHNDDQEDLKALTGIMKQYQEAYHSAERQDHLRGGILVPTNAYDEGVQIEDEDDGTFDIFFDANDQSLMKFASVMHESMVNGEKNNDISDFVHTKLRFHLLHGSLKIAFRDESRAHYSNEEYVLLSFDDLNASSSTSARNSDHSLTISHLEVEDSQLVVEATTNEFVSVGGVPTGRAEIGNVLRFLSESMEDDDDGDALTTGNALAIHVNKTRHTKSAGVTKVTISSAPIEVSYRHRTFANLQAFSKIASSTRRSSTSNVASSTPEEEPQIEQELHYMCSCPSLTLAVPMLKEINSDILFSRCGEILSKQPITSGYFGILIEDVTIESKSGSNMKFSCQEIITFASAPIGGRPSISTKMQRMDLFVASGRLEVEPYIPISLCYHTNESNECAKAARDIFPLVPNISSFKARQEDDDDENIDRVLRSKLDGINADSRKDLLGPNDPQGAMLVEAETCESVISVSIPRLKGDLTIREVKALSQIFDAVTPPTTKHDKAILDDKPLSSSICVSLSISEFSFGLHGDSDKNGIECSFLAPMDKVVLHAVVKETGLKHARFLCHNLAFYQASDHHLKSSPQQQVQGSSYRRGRNIADRFSESSNYTFIPIVYRSHLFTPISRESPSILLDLLNTSPENTVNDQKRVHLTLYHLTYRFDVDSTWMDRAQEMVYQLKEDRPVSTKNEVDAPKSSDRHCQRSSLTRVFVTLTDCNLDYTSAPYFKTSSRAIARLGDFRLSTNITSPAGAIQAFTISLGDLSFHVCNSHYPYKAENGKLCQARKLLKNDQWALESPRRTCNLAPDAVLRDMEFISILELNSLDAIIAVSSSSFRSKNGEAKTKVSLTMGLLSIHACKDSFTCFTETLGELQAKLTALSDEDLDKLKLSSSKTEVVNGNQVSPIKSVPLEGGDSTRLSPPTGMEDDVDLVPTIHESALKQDSQAFQLDGYDWTTVDHDPLLPLDMPDEAEQVAVWYNNPDVDNAKNESSGTSQQLPTQVFHQHFPLQSPVDPLADGDLGVAKYVGVGQTAPQVRSRIVVHNMSVKMRFFDGYDWPDALDERRRKACRNTKDFVIASVSQSKVRHQKKELSDKVETEGNDVNFDSVKRKAKLMGDLLHMPTSSFEGTKGSTEEAFAETPLPEDRSVKLELEAELRRLSRKPDIFFQTSANSVSLRMDSYEQSENYSLASILDLSVSDLFLAETISKHRPVKMFCEWVNENEHPRDSKQGTLMIKMVTWHPHEKVTKHNELASDICEFTMQLLPMRCIIYQRIISFVRAFTSPDEEVSEPSPWMRGRHLVPPPHFRAFRVKPWKIKIDYIPKKIDFTALREGSFVELVNLNPIDGMVITLRSVNVDSIDGIGSSFGCVVRGWIQDICATQLHKFLTHARPFEPFINIGGGMCDLVVLPYEAFKNGESVRKALRSGISNLAGTVAFETLTSTSKLTKFAAKQMSKVVGTFPHPGRTHETYQQQHYPDGSIPLPTRPNEVPSDLSEVTGHAMSSLSHGLQAANYKVIIVPYREYTRSGPTGAAKSVLRGIPVMIVAPMSGATEALSYTLLGARNALRPDIRKEEETIMRALGPDP